MDWFKNLIFLGALVLLVAARLPAARADGPPDASGLTRTLAATVARERVDYVALARDPKGLDVYLERAAGVARPAYAAWNAAQKKSFLINVYNAATLRLVLDHFPVHSIKDIGPFYSTPWKIKAVRLFGGQRTLDWVEGNLRAMGDPRVHFAIVCASKGCPGLQPFAYDAQGLEAELTSDARAFLGNSVKNRYDAATRTLWLSPIFHWFAKDFDAVGGVRAFVAAHAGDGAMAKAALDPSVRLDWTAYDWTLNAQVTP